MTSYSYILLLSLALAGIRARGATYYVAPGGDDGSAGDLAHPFATWTHANGVMSGGDTLIARGGTYNEDVSLVGWKSGSAGAFTIFRNYAGEVPMLQFAGHPAGSRIIDIDKSGHGVLHHLRFEGLRIDGSLNTGYADGFGVSEESHDVILTNCFISNIECGQGVMLHGHDDSNGIGSSDNVWIHGNTISNITWNPSFATDDKHCIYVNGGPDGVQIIGNHLLRSNNPGGGNGAPTGIQIQGALAYPPTAMVVRNNLIELNYRGMNYVSKPTALGDVRIYNNVFRNNTYGIFVAYGAQYGWIANNTIVATGSGNAILVEDYSVPTGPGNVFVNNLIATNTASALVLIKAGASATYWTNNMLVGGASANFSDLGGHAATSGELVGASYYPRFASYASDLNLQATSSARDAGYNLSSIFTTDYAGTTRSVPFDIGAYEYGGYIPPPLTVYYVATTGSDATGDGSSGNPFATVQHAVVAARAASIHDIKVGSGTYYLTEVLLTTADNGLTIEADTGATPILSGGTNLATWSTVGSYQQATLPTFPAAITTMASWQVRECLVDNVRIPWARLPTYGSWLNNTSADSSSTIMSYTAGDVPVGLVVANAELEARWIWDQNILPITANDTGAHTLTVSPAAVRNFGHWSEQRYALRNTLDGMAQGRWYHDRVNAKIVVQTNSLAGKVVTVPAASKIISVTGTSHGTPATGIVLSGLTLRCTTVPELADAFGSVYYPGAIHATHSSGLTITNCVVEHVGGAGISATFLNDNLGLVIVNNTVRDCGGTGIMFADGTASGNTVTDVGVQYLSAAAIYHNANGQVGATAPAITTNVVVGCPGDGIIAGQGVNDGTVRFNTVSNACQVMNDVAWIYSTTTTNTFIGFNRLYGAAYSTNTDRYGIYLDDTATACKAVSNVTYNVSVPILVHSSTNCVFTNNYFLATGGDMRVRISVAGTTTMTRNIFDYPNRFGTGADSGLQPTWTGNLFWSGATTVPSGATFADPLFDSNYALRLTASPAWALGINAVLGSYSGDNSLGLTASLNFGDTHVGDVNIKPIYLTNLGASSATWTSAGLAAPFSISPTSGTLTAGEVKTISAYYSPVVQATDADTLVVTSGANSYNSAFSGNATNVPAFVEVTPMSVSYGSVITNTSTTVPVYSTNKGELTLVGGTATVVGTGFSVTSGSTLNLAPGSGMATTVKFNPTTVGTYTGTLTVVGMNTVVIPLEGTGIVTPPVPPTETGQRTGKKPFLVLP